ncbi:MAG: hypothetical protein DRQ64_00285 [Gammaproteobacteria bacterium]|nr:MAG: hypothetical protein DRQ64_00285 [Gammaproteobacteria bacterium]
MVFTKEEIDQFREVVVTTLREGVESGNRVVPAGFALSTVSPTSNATKSLGQAFYGRPVQEPEDVLRMSMLVRALAMRGQARSAAMALVTEVEMLPSNEMFETDAESVAVIYLDHLQDRYEVWYAPVIEREDATPTVGEFIKMSGLSHQTELPHLLPLDLYGPAAGTA